MTKLKRIGISACMLHQDPTRTLFNGRQLLYLETSMADYVSRAGALPYLLPTLHKDSAVTYSDLLSQVDGLILHGGSDVSPTSYGEAPMRPEWAGDLARDIFERALIETCLARNIPILGICRGAQILNVVLGGTLYQDINTQKPGSFNHRDADLYQHNTHTVELKQDSTLAKLYGTTTGTINSVHHQAVKTLAPDLVLEAWSTHDGVAEAFILPSPSPQTPFARGVQWHPEFQDPKDNTLLSGQPLLDEFFDAIDARQS